MFISAGYYLKRIAFLVFSYSFKLENVPEVFRLFADFLKREPDSSFLFTEFAGAESLVPLSGEKAPSMTRINVPLTLTPEAENKFRTQMSEYPSVYESGKASFKTFNLIYALGQYLTIVALFLEFSEDKISEDKARKLYNVWGSRENMNAMRQCERYSNKSTEYAKRDLISKLEKSIKIIKEEILPFFHR